MILIDMQQRIASYSTMHLSVISTNDITDDFFVLTPLGKTKYCSSIARQASHRAGVVMSDVFHLGLKKADLQGAKLAIVPGDPERVAKIAKLMEKAEHLCSHREYTIWRAFIDQHAIIVCSTGIGGPSTSIAVEELAQLGIETFLRVGTTGAIQEDIDVASVIVTTGSVRLDGASRHFAPLAYPAVADYTCTKALVDTLEAQGVPYRTGITASSDTFYPGQERYDTITGYVRKSLQGSMREWQQLGVLNYEMESATLLTMCSALGLKAGCVAGVIVNRTQKEIPSPETLTQVELRAITTVVEAAKRLVTA